MKATITEPRRHLRSFYFFERLFESPCRVQCAVSIVSLNIFFCSTSSVINCAGSLWSSGRRIYAVTEQGESDQPRQIKTQPDNSSRTQPVPSILFLLLHLPLTNERELASQREFATNNDERDKIRLHPENIPPSAEYPANIPGHLVGFCAQAE